MAPNQDQELNLLLAGYAMGALPAPLSVLVAGHLELTPRNRAYVADLEALAGRAVEEVAPAPVRDRDAKLAAIFGLPQEAGAAAAPVRRRPRLPEAICRFVGHDADTLPWKTLLPGVKEYRVGEFEGMRTSLFWIRAGQKLPHHTHDEGTEVTLVLEGGFSDLLGSYDRGDISFTDSTVDHQPVADDDGDCIGFSVSDARLRLTGPIGRLFNPFIRA